MTDKKQARHMSNHTAFSISLEELALGNHCDLTWPFADKLFRLHRHIS